MQNKISLFLILVYFSSNLFGQRALKKNKNQVFVEASLAIGGQGMDLSHESINYARKFGHDYFAYVGVTSEFIGAFKNVVYGAQAGIYKHHEIKPRFALLLGGTYFNFNERQKSNSEIIIYRSNGGAIDLGCEYRIANDFLITSKISPTFYFSETLVNDTIYAREVVFPTKGYYWGLYNLLNFCITYCF